MADAVRRFDTLEEFLDWERQQEERYEYLDGIVTMRAGGSIRHTRIAENVKSCLRDALRGSGCTVLGSDAKVILARRSTYPDVSVTCAHRRRPHRSRPGSGRGDRGRKPEQLRSGHPGEEAARLPDTSGQHYAVVEQEVAFVDLFSRAGDTWANLPADGLGAAIELTALGVSLPLASLYEGISFAEPPG